MEDFFAEIERLVSGAVHTLECDQSAQGIALRKQQQAEERQALEAIFGPDCHAESNELLTFQVFRETVPSQPHAPLLDVTVAFLITEEYPAIPVVFELQGAYLSFAEADELFYAMFTQALDSAGEPMIFALVNLARETVANMAERRQQRKLHSDSGAPSAAASTATTTSATTTTADEEEEEEELHGGSHEGNFARIAGRYSSTPEYFADTSMMSIVDEVRQRVSGYSITRIENVVRVDLATNFLKARSAMKGRSRKPVESSTSRYNRSKNLANPDRIQRAIELKHLDPDPVIAYHGTTARVMPLIVQQGLRMPKEVGHRTDSGYYGAGMYLSPDPLLSLGYSENQRLLICAVLLGKPFMCPDMMHGASLQRGFDSHISPGHNEYVLFQPSQVLPLFVLHLQARPSAPARHAPPPPLDPAPAKNNASFYFPSHYKVLEMAEVDDDDDRIALDQLGDDTESFQQFRYLDPTNFSD
eukprot:m.272465 g.272465  ORF g.272465 m.272465 type:complete len:473 (+) comp54795_c0_seq3:208-1626(+)